MTENYLKGFAEAIIPYLMPYFENKVKDELLSFSPIRKTEEQELLTKKQVSERYQISLQTLWRYEKIGKLIPVRIGSKVMYRPKDIENLFI